MVGRRSLNYNAVFVLLLAAKRRLARNAKLRPLFRDGCVPSVTTTLKEEEEEEEEEELFLLGHYPEVKN
jgi:hypothetical protein